jgi:hypothetical protein
LSKVADYRWPRGDGARVEEASPVDVREVDEYACRLAATHQFESKS